MRYAYACSLTGDRYDWLVLRLCVIVRNRVWGLTLRLGPACGVALHLGAPEGCLAEVSAIIGRDNVFDILSLSAPRRFAIRLRWFRWSWGWVKGGAECGA